MVRPTLEQVFCHTEFLITEYEALGVKDARPRLSAMANQLFCHFVWVGIHERYAVSITRLYKNREKSKKKPNHILARRSPTRFRKDLAEYRKWIFLYRSIVKRSGEKLERRVALFPELSCDIPDTNKKMVTDLLTEKNTLKNFRKRISS